jgi:periplasmic divalent cation tolerance protein
MTDFRIALVTHPDLQTASRLARIIVEEKLCACANLIPSMHSIYMWKGNMEESSEVLMIIKTHVSKIEELEKRLRQLHPYEVFEFLELPVLSGHKQYLDWVIETLQQDGQDI